MRKVAIAISVSMLLVALGDRRLEAQQAAPPQPDVSRSAAGLEQLAKKTANLHEFGRAVSQQVLLAAARIRRERGDKAPLKVTISFDVTELFPPPPPGPKPGSDLDLCAMMCSDYACHVQCMGPEIGGGRPGDITPPVDRCESLRRQAEQVQWSIILECVMPRVKDLFPPRP